MSREPPEPLQLDYLIKAGAIHSMTGRTYRSVGVRGAEIVVVSADPDGRAAGEQPDHRRVIRTMTAQERAAQL